MTVLCSCSCMLWLSNNAQPEVFFPLSWFSCQKLRVVMFRRMGFCFQISLLPSLSYFLTCCGIWVISHLLFWWSVMILLWPQTHVETTWSFGTHPHCEKHGDRVSVFQNPGQSNENFNWPKLLPAGGCNGCSGQNNTLNLWDMFRFCPVCVFMGHGKVKSGIQTESEIVIFFRTVHGREYDCSSLQ